MVSKDRPWKYQELADVMMQIQEEDECNDTYGRIRLYQALKSKQPANLRIPSERTVYRVMEEIGLSHRPNHKPNGIIKADRQAQMSEDLLHRDFHAGTPLSKCGTDMIEIPACDELYISALFDCYDAGVFGLSIDTNIRASLCVRMLDNEMISYQMLRGAILHSDRGSQYTSQLYREAIQNYGIRQSMNRTVLVIAVMITRVVRVCGHA